MGLPNEPMRTPIALALSGSDPSGGAGLEADLKVFQRHGVYGMAVPTLLTVQNTTGVRKVKTLEPDFFEEQVDFLLQDLFPDVIKIGAIGDRRMLQALVRLLGRERLAGVPVVIDTVLGSTSGSPLFDMRGLSELMDRLLPRATLITPNVPEFTLLTGKEVGPGTAASHLRDFARDKPYAVLLKGGHFPGAPIDFLWHEGRIREFAGERIETPHTHGTGCALAAAAAANLALGHAVPEAAARARAYVREAIRGNPGLGSGRGPLGFNAAY
jgi:hydroxymethylpyrimidine/phosphomethylpyrimidine kinase